MIYLINIQTNVVNTIKIIVAIEEIIIGSFGIGVWFLFATITFFAFIMVNRADISVIKNNVSGTICNACSDKYIGVVSLFSKTEEKIATKKQRPQNVTQCLNIPSFSLVIIFFINKNIVGINTIAPITKNTTVILLWFKSLLNTFNSFLFVSICPSEGHL